MRISRNASRYGNFAWNSALAGVFALALVSPAAAQTPQVSDEVVKIGVLTDMSSSYADTTGQGSVEAAKMAVEDFGGVVLGKKIEIVSADHQNKADIGSVVARKWLDSDKVDAIVDVPNSAVAFAVLELVRERSKVFMITSAGSSDLTDKACAPTSFQWVFNTYAFAKGMGTALSSDPANKNWYFLTADYAFGHALDRDTSRFVQEAGGKVLGRVRHPLNAPDFSSFLLQAQASRANVIGLANGGGDTINAIKQAHEFGLTKGGQKLAGLTVFIDVIHGIGLDIAQGLITIDAFYADLNDETREFNRRYLKRVGKAPSMGQAGVYSAVSHYLKAVQAAGSDDGKLVAQKMRELPVNDFMSKNIPIRADGQVLRDLHILEVKSPKESKAPWDYYKLIRTIDGSQAWRPVSESSCPMLKQ